MTAIPDQHLPRYTLAEYLAFEEASESKHEFHAGEVLAMSGSSPEHVMITANLIRIPGNGLEGSPCGLYSSDLKIYIEDADRVCYPDASAICGPLQFHPRDNDRRLFTNPRVIVEVLSPTTEGYDRGAKFRDYRTLPSFEEYVLISQNEPLVETILRQPDGNWLIRGAYLGLDAVAVIRCLRVELKLSQIYSRVDFQPQPASSHDRK